MMLPVVKLLGTGLDIHEKFTPCCLRTISSLRLKNFVPNRHKNSRFPMTGNGIFKPFLAL